MTPSRFECPHRCCCDDGPHDHAGNAVDCEACIALADVHPLARRALSVGAKKYPTLQDENEEKA